jgi:hypothetical protein
MLNAYFRAAELLWKQAVFFPVDRRPTSIHGSAATSAQTSPFASQKGPPKSPVLSFDLLPDFKPCGHELHE